MTKGKNIDLLKKINSVHIQNNISEGMIIIYPEQLQFTIFRLGLGINKFRIG